MRWVKTVRYIIKDYGEIHFARHWSSWEGILASIVCRMWNQSMETSNGPYNVAYLQSPLYVESGSKSQQIAFESHHIRQGFDLVIWQSKRCLNEISIRQSSPSIAHIRSDICNMKTLFNLVLGATSKARPFSKHLKCWTLDKTVLHPPVPAN